MAQAIQDSSLDLAYGSWADVPLQNELPILDLTSTDPLPSDLGLLPDGPQPRSAVAPVVTPPAAAPDTDETVYTSDDGSIQLRGDVLMCGCPECGAPMSIRLWLMLADCWRCATTIELNEEQEREVQRLLKKRELAQQAKVRRQAVPATPAAAPQPPAAKPQTPPPQKEPPPPPKRETPPPLAKPTPPPTPKRPAQQPEQPRRVAASKKPRGVRAKYRKMAVLGAARVLVGEFFKQTPAWITSLLFHLIVAALLWLFTIGDDNEPPAIVLSVDMNQLRQEGETEAVNVGVEPRYDQPDVEKTDNDQEWAQTREQDAKELRIDPDAPLPQLPDLHEVKELIGASDMPQRMLAARDPRVRVEMIEQEGGTTTTEAAVSRGLRWFSKQQEPDGSWRRIDDSKSGALARTSLALLPFLGAGQTHQAGIYQDEVSKGLRWLVDRQKPDGDLRLKQREQYPGMYGHAIGTIVLCEAYAMTGDEQFRIPAQQAIDYIVKAQYADGGWRYRPAQEVGPREKGDTSVVGWQLMALQSARAAKLTVPDSTLEQAAHFLDAVSPARRSDRRYPKMPLIAGATYSYTAGSAPTETMTAEGLLCRMYLGWNKYDDPALNDGVQWLANHQLPRPDRMNMYYWYYATQVMHHYGGDEWERWNLHMRSTLTETQVTSGQHAGSWSPSGPHHDGRIYQTSLAVCSLEVYYRHSPIYRQIKLD